MSTRSEFEVVSPVGVQAVETIPLAPALSSLEGKTISLVWNIFPNGDVILDGCKELLEKRVRGLKFAKIPPEKGEEWGEVHFDNTVGSVAKEAGADAAIVAIGG